MALLDRDGLYGAPRFHMEAAKFEDMKAHIGAEITLALEDGHTSSGKNNDSPTVATLPLLVETRTGYQNLCRFDYSDETPRAKARKARRDRRDILQPAKEQAVSIYKRGSRWCYDIKIKGTRHRATIPEARTKCQALQAEEFAIRSLKTSMRCFKAIEPSGNWLRTTSCRGQETTSAPGEMISRA